MKSILMMIILCSPPAKAFELSAITNKISSYFDSLLGKIDETSQVKKSSKNLILMPKILKEQKSATAIGVYNKNGVIFIQGQKFNKLKLEQKRQYNLKFLEELFESTRAENVSDSTIANYINILEQGGSREGIYRAIVLDRRYSQLEQYPVSYKKKTLPFIIKVADKFLGKKYSENQLKKFNRYTIKRIFSEKLISVLDVYALKSKPENIYSWYAHFSVMCSFYKIWNNKTRMEKSLEYHYNWSKNVPFQHIKSEVLIKFNKLVDHMAELK